MTGESIDSIDRISPPKKSRNLDGVHGAGRHGSERRKAAVGETRRPAGGGGGAGGEGGAPRVPDRRHGVVAPDAGRCRCGLRQGAQVLVAPLHLVDHLGLRHLKHLADDGAVLAVADDAVAVVLLGLCADNVRSLVNRLPIVSKSFPNEMRANQNNRNSSPTSPATIDKNNKKKRFELVEMSWNVAVGFHENYEKELRILG